MDSDCKVMMDAAVFTEGGKPKVQGDKPRSRLTTALLLFTLCLAVAATAFLILNQPSTVSRQGQDDDSIHHAMRQISNVRAAIHLEGKYNAAFKPEEKTSVEWQLHVDQSHSQGGLTLKDNEIVIPQDGLYFVYSQAAFQVSCSADDLTSEPMVHLSHIVTRWSDSYKTYRNILHSVRTACKKTVDSDSDAHRYSTVYMGAVFDLIRGDKLKTVTAEKVLPNLEDDSGKTFFGVFAL